MSGGFLPPVVATLRADISDYQAKMGIARGETASLASQGGGNMEKFAAVGKTALIGLGAVAVAAAVVGVKAAMDQEAAQARLDTAIKNSHQSVSKWGGAVEEASSHAINMGFSDVALESSLAKLVPVTSNVGQATHEMGLAEDIARGRHIDLEAATQILVKVQTGHVSLLGRMGIATKDATGATISQEEAMRRLTDLYGGNASRYTHTLSGEFDVLQATGEHLAEQLGQVLIPIITGVGTALADGISWVTQDKDALIALAIVVGGPLAIAMGVYVVQTAIAAAETGYLLALMAADKVVAFAGAIMEGVSSLLALGPATLLAAGGLVAVAAAIVYFESTDGVFERNQAAAKSWGDTLVASAKSTGHELQSLTATHAVLDSEIYTNKAKIQDLEQNYAKYGLTLDQANNRALHLGYATDLLQQKNKIVTDTIQQLNAEHKKNLIVAEAVAKSMGVTIPGAAQMTSTELKNMQKAVAASSDEFGTWGTQAMLNVGLTASAISGVTKQAQQFGTDVASSWSGFVGQITSHDFSQPVKEQAQVSEQSMEEFFVGSALKANEWQGDLQHLIDAGVSPSLVNMFAKAGPSADENLKAVDSMVDLHGAAWTNSIMASGDAQRAQLQASYNAETVDLAIAQAERKALYDATNQAINGGNEQALQNLTQSTDKNLARMAQSVWDQYHTAATNAQGQMGTIPTDRGFTVHAVMDTSNFDANWAHTQSVIDNLNSQGVHIHVFGANVGAHGLVGLARGGSAGMIVGPNQPVLIGEGLSHEAVVPFDNFGDMVNTIKNTGRASDFMRASIRAGGIPSFTSSGSPTSAEGGGGGGAMPSVTVIVRGSVVTERDLVDAVQEGLLRNARQGRGALV